MNTNHRKAIKNYTSDIPINRIFERIQQVLAQHGTKRIAYDYGEDGKVYGITFTILLQHNQIQVKLPARVENAQAVLQQQYESGLITRKTGKQVYAFDHAYRVAWRNILDWVEAQMALIDIEMAKLEEIFLPYMVDTNGRTYFEHLEKQQFLLPDTTA
jgi:hypothetical protein